MGTYIPASLRRLVAERAQGRCEYCLIPEMTVFIPHEIDHVIAQKHGGVTQADNLALAWTLCNQHKGSDVASFDAETGELVRLFHPRQHTWSEHFCLEGAEFIPLTAIGRVTIRLLQLNRPERIAERELLIAAGIFGVFD